MVPAVAADNGLEVTTAYPAIAVAPGAKASFDLKVTSTRQGNVALSMSGVPEGWTASLHGGGNVVDGVLAGPGVDATVRLDVQVPGTAAEASQTITVKASESGRTDELPISVRVNAGAAGDIKVDTNTPALTGSSNGSFPFALTVHNDTAQDVTVSATAAVTDHPDWQVKTEIAGESQAASTVVTAAGTASVNVTVTPPENAPAGDYAVHVEVKAGEQTIPGDFKITITGSYSLTLSTPDQVLSGSGGAGSAKSQQFVVTNTGTAPLEAVKMTATTPSDWTVKFDQETVPTVAPGESATVTAAITPSGNAVTGDYNITIRAANDQANQDATYRFTVETSPIWAIVSLLVIVAIIGGLAWVFRTYGRR
ncbi:MAG: NEW3 domain-containing protein [Chloroflexota bacterium]